MTENPYAPPKARVEAGPTPSARASGLFWVHFYLSPSGRTGRLFYWLFGFLPLALIGAAVTYIVLGTPNSIRYLIAVAVLLFWPQAVLLTRRLHDLNLPGWWVVLLFAIPPALNHTPLGSESGNAFKFFAAVVLGLIPGTAGPNEYGSDPRNKNNLA